MNSVEILRRLDDIAADSSVTAKTRLLTEALKDEDFFVAVQYALDPFRRFNVRPNRYTGFAGNWTFTSGTYALLNNLITRELSGDAAKSAIEAEYKRLDPDSAELLWRILNKDLRAGFGKTLCNKVSPGMFASFPYCRCSLMSDVKVEEWDWYNGIISQKKADGMFVNADNEEGIATLRSRQGEPLPRKGFEDIYDAVAMLTPNTQTHGEIEVLDADGNICPREIGNGMINEVSQGGDWAPGHKPVLKVWDQIPLSAVQPKSRYKDMPYVKRLKELNAQVRNASCYCLEMIETRIVRSLAEAYRHYVEILKAGGEGTVIKKPSMIWGDYTSKEQIKLKLEATCELIIKGFKAGKAGKKTENTFGSLELASQDDLLEVNCSGMSDDLRKEINNNREKYLGGIVSVTFNGVMHSKKAGKKHSLFLPRLDEIRFDKTEADTFEKILKQVDNAITLIEAQAKAGN